GRCTRENCKYLHPPPHLKTQLEINGRNTLATQKMLQNLQNQQLQQVVGMHNMANLQLQPSPASTLLQGSPTLPTGPGSNPVVIPTSQVSGKDTNSVPTASAASFYQHASPQMYSGLQILTQPSYSLPTVGQGASPYHTSQASTDTNAVYSPYIFPVAVTMAPTMTGGSHSAAGTYSPYMMPFSQSGAFTGLGGVTASPMGLMQDFAGLQTPVIPGHTGPSFPILPTIKPKNDKLEVCREFQRGSCSRGEAECKFAHPDEHITIDTSDNTVTVCMDHVKGRCSREKCKYFHPPLHLQAKIKAAQQQGNNPNLAGVLPTTNESQSLKRPRESSDDALLNLTGLVPPPTKKSHTTAGTVAGQGTGPMMNLFPQPPIPYHHHLNQAMLHSHQPTPVVPTPYLVQRAVVVMQTARRRLPPPENAATPQPDDHRPLAHMQPTVGVILLIAAWAKKNVTKPTPTNAGARWRTPTAMPASASVSVCVMCVRCPGGATVPVMPSMATVLLAPAPALSPHTLCQRRLQTTRHPQSNETIPVCRDFKSGSCKRPSCKYAHVTEDYVEVVDGKVTMCRDAVRGKCLRATCKYYHAPASAAATHPTHVATVASSASSASSSSSSSSSSANAGTAANASLLFTATASATTTTSTSSTAAATAPSNASAAPASAVATAAVLPPHPPIQPQPPIPFSATAAAVSNPYHQHLHHHHQHPASTFMPIALSNGFPAQVLP
ncbi:uncharacterized protein, partial [Diadema antillarum]|uniref:uncharacterized protein n=1 Tax=Diadema antillarum TaxID=105358 RepID=UPI003A849130